MKNLLVAAFLIAVVFAASKMALNHFGYGNIAQLY